MTDRQQEQLIQRADAIGIRLEIIAGLPVWEAAPAARHQKALFRIQSSLQPLPGNQCGCFPLADTLIRFPDGSLKRPDIAISLSGTARYRRSAGVDAGSGGGNSERRLRSQRSRTGFPVLFGAGRQRCRLARSAHGGGNAPSPRGLATVDITGGDRAGVRLSLLRLRLSNKPHQTTKRSKIISPASSPRPAPDRPPKDMRAEKSGFRCPFPLRPRSGRRVRRPPTSPDRLEAV